MRTNNKGIYIHIPFCVEKCLYCDFLSGKAKDEEKQQYVAALKKEIRLTGKMLAKIETADEHPKAQPVDTVFFGGGTPSILPGEIIADILTEMRRCFALTADCEITVECNPGTLTTEKLKCYKVAGVNRISLGLQSAENHLLKKIGRIHTYEQFLQSYEMAKQAGFDNINIDLMSGLPGQTMSDLISTLDKIVALRPTHISAYSLILEEETPLARMNEAGYATLPDEESEMEMYRYITDFLQENGYQRYEISNYCLPGRECRHNLRYWDVSDYLGVGVGAASLCDGRRYRNISKREEYVRLLTSETGIDVLGRLREEEQNLTENEQMEEFAFLGLRKTAGISKVDFAQRFGKDIHFVYGHVIKKLLDWQLLEEDETYLRLTSRGIDMSNEVLAEFLLS